MKLYIHSYSSYRSDVETENIKQILKQKYKYDTRRQDDFILLGVYGAYMLKESCNILPDDELYITSGIGNIDVLQKCCRHVYEKNQLIRPFDFINSVGNTLSYHIAKSLQLKGKNIFQISDNFTYLHTLILIYASLTMSKKSAIIGTIDHISEEFEEIARKASGIDEKTTMFSSVNFQKLSLKEENALAEIDFENDLYTLEEIKNIMQTFDGNIKCSIRCKKLDCTKEQNFFETEISNAVNQTLESKQNLLYVDCYNDKYKILRVRYLK
ncbi:hypothetical protein RZR97_10915 [Hydrogenimonas thermophila]|uniref:hypothetical protein n=1 Tax=Hydrogenimonas thermophila TaxID=223786 RepID=UPI0029373CED|nr:hypothetical protein [Hydrogenimonas thermophila]WOE69605.1 hypothetical protein RZR91_10925 [Hydrogenimonas thermophila]WOE72119.1 hypothetical protein RZR97_10915 [Hydrogenimonas thermophila]